MRSTAAAARRRASISWGSLTSRSGPMISDVVPKRVEGRARWRATRNWAQVRLPMAAVVRRAEELGDDRDGVVGLAPGPDAEDVVADLDPGHLEGGNHQRGHAVAGHHQHGEALEGHGLVADQPGQVGADGEQAGVDPLLGHGGPDPGEAIGVHRGEATGPSSPTRTRLPRKWLTRPSRPRR